VGEEGKEGSGVLLLLSCSHPLFDFQVERVEREEADGQPAGHGCAKDAQEGQAQVEEVFNSMEREGGREGEREGGVGVEIHLIVR
jgi:hypothetical protein